MVYRIEIILLTTLLYTICQGLNELPSYLKVCHKSQNEHDLFECMKDSVENLRPLLKNGIKEINIPSIDPINVGDLIISETASSSSGGIKISIKNLVAHRSSEFDIKSIETIEYGKEYKMAINFPRMNVEGTYDVNGRILLLPIRGSGPFTGNFTNCQSVSHAFVGTKKIGDDEFVYMKQIKIKIKVGRGQVKLKNLFNGDRLLGEAVNDVINQNFDLLSKDIIPLVERALERNIRDISNKIVERYTYDQLFPL